MTVRSWTKGGAPAVERQAAWLQQFPAITVTIEGHTDQRGTTEYNLALGERRAKAVKSYLTSLGIDPARILIISYGKERIGQPGQDRAGLRREPPRDHRGQCRRDQLNRSGAADRGPCGVACFCSVLAALPALAAEPPNSAQRGGQGRPRSWAGSASPRPRTRALRTAGLEIRIARLEELLRQLTGRIEEVEYAQRQTSARIDRLVGDLDARLPGANLTAGQAAPPPREEARSSRHRRRPRRREVPPSIIAPDASAQQGHVLGTIPQDAVTSQPPPPAPQARLTPQGADADYKQALDLLQAGNWAQAEQAFTGFVQSYPDDSRAPDRLLLAGRDLFVPQGLPDRGLGVRPQLPHLRPDSSTRAGQSAQVGRGAGRDGRPGARLPDLRRAGQAASEGARADHAGSHP